MSDVSAIFAGRQRSVGQWLAPLARQFWMIVLVVSVGALASLAYGRLQSPLYEASAVVQVQTGVSADHIAAHVLRPDNLVSTAVRQGLALAGAGTSRAKAAVLIRKAISVNTLTSEAGQALGYPAQVAGVVVSVLLPDADAAARVANDLAQQILDLGNAGQLTEIQEERDFYRRDELRLWQEVSALRAEQEQAAVAGLVGAMDAAIAGQRQMMLMQDQYDLVRQKLADSEIAARLATHLQAGQFSLLGRASAAEAVALVEDWMLVGVAGSLLLAVTLAFVLERRYPALKRGPGVVMAALRARMAGAYRLFDDPARPILGIPRYLVTSALIVVWLYVISAFIR